MGGFTVYDLRFAVYDNANDGIQDWLNARRHLYLSNSIAQTMIFFESDDRIELSIMCLQV